MAKHRQNAKCKDRMHFAFYSKVDEIGIEHYIELIEDCPCETLEQLRKREGHYIRKMGTLNCLIAGRTGKEWEQDNKDKRKEYREINKDKIQIYHKEYVEQNKDKINKNRK